MLRILLLAHTFCQAIAATAVRRTGMTEDYYDCFNTMEVSGPIRVRESGTVIQNKIIIASPTSANDRRNDFAINIPAGVHDVTIKNVRIYHAANGIGIYARKTKNLRIENVQVEAYGNAWGAGPCPTRLPFGGYDCAGIRVF